MGIFKTLSDAFQRTFADSAVAPNITTEMGRAGTSIFSGFITEDFNSDFHGQNAIRIYDKMRKNDATVNGVLTAMKLPILQAERSIESADPDDDLQNEIADFVRKNLFENLEGGFTAYLREVLSYLDFGFYYFEKVYEVKDGMVWIKRLAPRQPSAHLRWQMNTQPKVPGVTQSLKGYDSEVGPTPEIPMAKLVLFSHNKEGDNYEGISVLRSAYKHWYFKDNLYRIDGIKHERGAGVLKIVLPEAASDNDKTLAEELGENFKINEAAYIVQPNPNWNIELMTTGIADQSSALIESVRHHDRQIAINILAQFMDLGSGSSGSYALSQDQTSFFTLALRSIADYVAEVNNTQLVKELVDLNFGEQEEYPKIRFGEIGQVDFSEMSTSVKTLIDAGLVDVTPEMKAWAHKTFKLPAMVVDDFEDEEDRDLDNMVADLALLEAEIAGLPQEMGGGMEQEGMEPDMGDEELMAKAQQLPDEEKQKIGLSSAFEFGKKGEPLSEETKRKISEALKKNGGAEESTLEGKFKKDQEIGKRLSNIADAKRRIGELRAVITSFKDQSRAISDRKTKIAFNKSIKGKIEEIRTMIAAGLMGIKAERGRIEGQKDVIRDEHKTEQAVEREQKARDRLKAKQEKIEENISETKQKLSKAKTPDARNRIQKRIDEMNGDLDEIGDKLKSAQPISLAERTFNRELTLAEQRVKLAEIDEYFSSLEDEILARLAIASDDQKESLLREAEKIIDKKDIAAITLLALYGIPGLATDIKAFAKQALEEGKRTSANEIGQALPTTPSARTKIVNARVDLLLEERAAEILGTMKKKILDVIQKEIGKSNAIHELSKAFDDISDWWNKQIAGRIAVDTFNDGRDLVFDTNRIQIHGLQRSEILDLKTCPMCMSLDERVVAPTDPFSRIGQIHTNCRGLWVAVLKTDSELPKVKQLPKSITNRFDTVEGIPSVNEFEQMKKPIVRKGTRLEHKIEDGIIQP